MSNDFLMTHCPHCGEWRTSLLEPEFCNTCGRLTKIQGEAADAAGKPDRSSLGPDAVRPSPLKLLAAALGLAALYGCAERPLKPEPPLPSHAQLAALLAAPVPHAKPSTPATFNLTVFPRAILQGASYRVTCYVPESLGTGLIRFGVEGIKVDGPHELLRAENTLLVDRAECGHWIASCRTQTTAGEKIAHQEIDVVGGMCDGQ